MPSFKVELTERAIVFYSSEIVVEAPTEDAAREAVSDSLDEVDLDLDWSDGREEESSIDIYKVEQCHDEPEWKVNDDGLLEEIERPGA